MKKVFICLIAALSLSTIGWADGFKQAIIKDIHFRMVNIITMRINSQTDREDIFYANGVIISQNFVLVAAHSVRDKDKIFIYRDSAVFIDKERIRFFDEEDFAFIDISGLSLAKVKPIKYGSVEKINYGQTVIIGSRLFFSSKVFFSFYLEGKICVIDNDFFLLDRSISKGTSGSGVYNQKGELIGLIVATTEFGGLQFTLAYKIDTIWRKILEKAVE